MQSGNGNQDPKKAKQLFNRLKKTENARQQERQQLTDDFEKHLKTVSNLMTQLAPSTIKNEQAWSEDLFGSLNYFATHLKQNKEKYVTINIDATYLESVKKNFLSSMNTLLEKMPKTILDWIGNSNHQLKDCETLVNVFYEASLEMIGQEKSQASLEISDQIAKLGKLDDSLTLNQTLNQTAKEKLEAEKNLAEEEKTRAEAKKATVEKKENDLSSHMHSIYETLARRGSQQSIVNYLNNEYKKNIPLKDLTDFLARLKLETLTSKTNEAFANDILPHYIAQAVTRFDTEILSDNNKAAVERDLATICSIHTTECKKLVSFNDLKTLAQPSSLIIDAFIRMQSPGITPDEAKTIEKFLTENIKDFVPNGIGNGFNFAQQLKDLKPNETNTDLITKLFVDALTRNSTLDSWRLIDTCKKDKTQHVFLQKLYSSFCSVKGACLLPEDHKKIFDQSLAYFSSNYLFPSESPKKDDILHFKAFLNKANQIPERKISKDIDNYIKNAEMVDNYIKALEVASTEKDAEKVKKTVADLLKVLDEFIATNNNHLSEPDKIHRFLNKSNLKTRKGTETLFDLGERAIATGMRTLLKVAPETIFSPVGATTTIFKAGQYQKMPLAYRLEVAYQYGASQLASMDVLKNAAQQALGTTQDESLKEVLSSIQKGEVISVEAANIVLNEYQPTSKDDYLIHYCKAITTSNEKEKTEKAKKAEIEEMSSDFNFIEKEEKQPSSQKRESGGVLGKFARVFQSEPPKPQQEASRGKSFFPFPSSRRRSND